MERKRHIDIEFVNSFIEECKNKGISSDEDICKEAQSKIEIIENEIKKHCKLKGVLQHFRYKKNSSSIKKYSKKEEKIEIEREKIDDKLYQKTMLFFDKVNAFKNGPIPVDDLYEHIKNEYKDDEKENILFVIKQMFINKILIRSKDNYINIK